MVQKINHEGLKKQIAVLDKIFVLVLFCIEWGSIDNRKKSAEIAQTYTE
jgi:hypothetical protein